MIDWQPFTGDDSDHPDVIDSEPQPREVASVKPPPAGSVRVKFLDGAFAGKIKIISIATAKELKDRIIIIDG